MKKLLLIPILSLLFIGAGCMGMTEEENKAQCLRAGGVEQYCACISARGVTKYGIGCQQFNKNPRAARMRQSEDPTKTVSFEEECWDAGGTPIRSRWDSQWVCKK